ncbi:MAG: hypothetical protein RL407_906, partial [Bacteroidota bacterium]
TLLQRIIAQPSTLQKFIWFLAIDNKPNQRVYFIK